MNIETRNDLDEIWKSIESIKNNLSKIEKYIMDDYYNEWAINYQYINNDAESAL